MSTETRRVGDGVPPWKPDELKENDVMIIEGVEYSIFALLPWEGNVIICATFGPYGNQMYFMASPTDTVEVKA